MYKKVLKHLLNNRHNNNIRNVADQKAGFLPDEENSNIKKSEYEANLSDVLFKSAEDDVDNKNIIKQPHIILTTENPRYDKILNMDNDELKQLLEHKGYNVQKISGKYGTNENSIFVSNPNKYAYKHFLNIAQKLGQESVLFSNGYDHELHYVNGSNSGMHHKGQGTAIYRKSPEDYYSILENGTIFQHHINTDQDPVSLKHSFFTKSSFKTKLEKNEGKKLDKLFIPNDKEEVHPFERPEGKYFIHYSKEPGLKELNPEYQGSGTRGADFREGKPEHPVTWFYLENTEPEGIVVSGAKSKYVVSGDGIKLYDIGKDTMGLRDKLRKESQGRQVNPGTFTKDELFQEIKNAGYGGYYNSSINNKTMSRVAGVFHPTKPKFEFSIHPNDFKRATAYNYHKPKESREIASNFASENGDPQNKNFYSGLLNRTTDDKFKRKK